DMTIFEQSVEAKELLGIRLEMVCGLPVWEAHPVFLHQKEIDRIRLSIRPIKGTGTGCECRHYSDLSIDFPDGSYKRPDISIFCREPDEKLTAVTLLPEAVVEVISKGYEAKDT